MKVWPNRSPLSGLETKAGTHTNKKPSAGEAVMSGWANHIEPIKGTRRRTGRM